MPSQKPKRIWLTIVGLLIAAVVLWVILLGLNIIGMFFVRILE
jgi:hypothetical protein